MGDTVFFGVQICACQGMIVKTFLCLILATSCVSNSIISFVLVSA